MNDTIICMPSRGTIFTRVIERVCGFHCPILFTSEVSTPQAFNDLVTLALSHHPQYIVFIEEDTVPPDGCIAMMKNVLESSLEIGAVCVEYPVKGGWSTVVHRSETGDILYCGLGCTMIRTEIFKKMKAPWFRADRLFSLNRKQWEPCDPTKQYGLYDVLFFTRMRKMGWKIAQISGRCEHVEIEHTFTPEQNGSVLSIKEKSLQIVRSQLPLDPVEYWEEGIL